MAKIDRAALRQKIQQLEGLTDEERSALMELTATERYGLVWEEREEAVEERLREELPVLVEDESLRIENGSGPNHILIEGDNLEALTALSYTHEGKVDVIYIDPPYNTGNKDFVYNDSFVDSEDSYRHSKWISFMSKRLRISKRLLSDRGVIFISIDDNEQANLKLLCDEVFGERNFVANLIWQKKFSRSNDALYFSTMHDFILCYCKQHISNNPNGWKIGLLKRQEAVPKGYSNPDNDPRGVWTSTIMSAKSGSPSLLYEIKTPSGRVVLPPDGRYWSCSLETFERWRSENRIWFGKDGDGTPRKKTFLSEVQEGLRPNTIIFQEEGGNNQEGRQELKEIGISSFDGPKPTKLLNFLMRIANTTTDATILDFFAGSGTTLHAVMQLNKEDGGKRQCILVTNNENNICREVTYQRNRRVIEGYTSPKGVQVEGLKENNLRYYRTQLLPRERTNRNMRALVAAATDLLCIKESIYDELKIENGNSKIAPRYARFFSEGDKRMMVIYDERVIPYVVDWLEHADSSYGCISRARAKIKVYVFSPGAYAWDDDFAPVIDRVELCALPEAIYQAYKNVLPPKRQQSIEIETAEKGDEQ